MLDDKKIIENEIKFCEQMIERYKVPFFCPGDRIEILNYWIDMRWKLVRMEKECR